MTSRITQEPIEVVTAVTDADARITQEPIEVVVVPTDADARMTQVVIEVVSRNLREHVQVQFID